MINEPSDNPAVPSEGVRAEPVSRDLLVLAAMRILPGAIPARRVAAERFVAGAEISGTDISRAFAVIDRSVPSKPWVRQSCFAVPGPGRTAMLLVSGPIGAGIETGIDQAERAACVGAASNACSGPEIAIVQALPDPSESWTVEALNANKFLHVGDLIYLERFLPQRSRHDLRRTWPPGISVRPIHDITRGSPDRDRLARLLERSYIGTLDCPELCGLRETHDIIDSHASTGDFNRTNWLMAFDGTDPVACALVNTVPESSNAELVYLGVAPEARARGLARALLESVIWGLAGGSTQRMVCAVDERNTPAANLYKSLGFVEFSRRRAFVRPTA